MQPFSVARACGNHCMRVTQGVVTARSTGTSCNMQQLTKRDEGCGNFGCSRGKVGQTLTSCCVLCMLLLVLLMVFLLWRRGRQQR